MSTIEEKVDTLEAILGRFIVHTDIALRKLETEMRAFQEEMRQAREKSDRDMQQFQEKSDRDMQQFREEMRQAREKSDRDMQQFQEKSDRDMQQFREEMRQAREKSDRDMQQFREEMQQFREEMQRSRDEAAQERREINRQWGDLANKMGTLVEDIVAPNLRGIAQRYFGCVEFSFFAVRVYKVHAKDRSKRREFDIVAICEDKLLVNETKSNPRVDYIDTFVEVLKEIPDYFAEYPGKKVIPIFASLYIPEDVVKYLTSQQIYAMGMREDTMDLLNFDQL